ncbi:MAG: VOC family protein [Thermomicrobiales bacterium]
MSHVVIEQESPTWPSKIFAITLFVEDLTATRSFYQDVFGLAVQFEDTVSAVFDFGNILVNLLNASEGPELIGPAVVSARDAGVRMQLTIPVDDVDATCGKLESMGVDLLNGPLDRPWGIRTATFRDPAGHIWEITKSSTE